MIDGRFVDCRYCGKPVARDAEFCPACGTCCPDHSAFVLSWVKRVVVAVVLVAVVIWFAWPRMAYLWKPQPVFEQKPLEFSASQLWELYQNDYVAAGEKYNDKPVSVTGKVVEISEFMYAPCLTLEVDSDYVWAGVICMFDEGDRQSLNYKVGDTVTVKGTCDGIDYGATVWHDERYPVDTSSIWIRHCE